MAKHEKHRTNAKPAQIPVILYAKMMQNITPK